VVVDRFSGRSRGFGFVTFDEKKLFMKFDGGKSNKQTKIIAPQSNDHAHLKFLVKELDGLCGLGLIVSETITNTWYCNDSRFVWKIVLNMLPLFVNMNL
ncbi:hypothetical protein IFM89_011506, partial [Coptis chinensis]